jgi:hypothetical protein
MNRETVHLILTEELGMKKICVTMQLIVVNEKFFGASLITLSELVHAPLFLETSLVQAWLYLPFLPFFVAFYYSAITYCFNYFCPMQ